MAFSNCAVTHCAVRSSEYVRLRIMAYEMEIHHNNASTSSPCGKFMRYYAVKKMILIVQKNVNGGLFHALRLQDWLECLSRDRSNHITTFVFTVVDHLGSCFLETR